MHIRVLNLFLQLSYEESHDSVLMENLEKLHPSNNVWYKVCIHLTLKTSKIETEIVIFTRSLGAMDTGPKSD